MVSYEKIKHDMDLSWAEFYMEFADKLREYANNRVELIEKIVKVYSIIDMKLPKLEKDNKIIDIDPFTVFALFNKNLTDENRRKIITGFKELFNVKSKVPESYAGIPVLNPLKATYYRFVDNRDEADIDNLWEMFISALDYADNHTEKNRKEFIKWYDIVITQNGIKWNLTMGLYWIRPYDFVNLDSRNRWYITNAKNMPVDYVENLGDLKEFPDAESYLNIIDSTRKALDTKLYEYATFPELSHYAWIVSEQVNKGLVVDYDEPEKPIQPVINGNVDSVRYWIYAPGAGACMWDEFYNAGIMAIGWGEIGNLADLRSKDEMKQKMKECYDPTLSYKNVAHATWQFANEMKEGDIVFVKKGQHSIIGKGVITSEYMFDENRNDEYKNIRKVNWIHNGEWEHPSGQAVLKTLTDITIYTDYVKQLCALFEEEEIDVTDEKEVKYPVYDETNFLEEVYMDEESYKKLVNLLRYKKNIILQGAPGVGKTFAAKRLAYSMMGIKDTNRVMFVQFHQSYSYEDFIMGFRPEKSGNFELKTGPFYDFCKEAEIDSENDYYFIIDEINRGNLSKIFGELFVLLEKDKRGMPIQLLYANEKFTVPSNVYIIGMMNTADRSLAMLDYALRRRFGFFEFNPAFDTDGFQQYQQTKANKKFDNLIDAVKKLNITITEDEMLGRGFRIGHSYFDTENNVDDLWLSSVVNYEIVPLLEEYWFDEPQKVRDWKRTLQEAIK